MLRPILFVLIATVVSAQVLPDGFIKTVRQAWVELLTSDL
jgi:hypothetical protein